MALNLALSKHELVKHRLGFYIQMSFTSATILPKLNEIYLFIEYQVVST